MSDTSGVEPRTAHLSSEELEQAVEQGVVNALIRLGLDASKPMDLQRDFQFLRDLRKSTESVKGKAIVTIVGILVAGGVAVVWLGIKAMVHPPH